jgi:GMP synthase-like glutamine amidotransferase
MNIHWFQHVPFEGLGSIEHWAKRRGHQVSATRLYREDPLPDEQEVDGLIVMGGPMNIYEEDRYPWLLREKRFIEDAIKADKAVIGICLGAQLIADVLGAKVYTGRHKEIGWFPIYREREAQESKIFRDFPSEMEAFHWHGDTFDLPSGCIRIAESAVCKNQAFVYDERVVGLQFHLEITRQGAKELISNCRAEIVEASFIQSVEEMLSTDDRFIKANERMERLLDVLSTV